jgi:AcrR family transcriptional regulator
MEPTAQSGGRGAALRAEDGRLRRGRLSRARIRAAARSLFAERGFDGATLRAIAERAGMGASSIYRHVRSKEELLVQELADLQEEAWTRFRAQDRRTAATQDRVRRFFQAQHELLAEGPDLTVIALRATTHPGARVARRVLALNDRTIGLLAEILQGGRVQGDLDQDVDILAAARALFHMATGARISWANGLLSEAGCRGAIEACVDLLFDGLAAGGGEDSAR